MLPIIPIHHYLRSNLYGRYSLKLKVWFFITGKNALMNQYGIAIFSLLQLKSNTRVGTEQWTEWKENAKNPDIPDSLLFKLIRRQRNLIPLQSSVIVKSVSTYPCNTVLCHCLAQINDYSVHPSTAGIFVTSFKLRSPSNGNKWCVKIYEIFLFGILEPHFSLPWNTLLLGCGIC